MEESKRDREGPLVMTSAISKVERRPLATDFHPPRQRGGSFYHVAVGSSSTLDTGICAVSEMGCLAFCGLVKRGPEAIMSAHKKCSEIYIYAL